MDPNGQPKPPGTAYSHSSSYRCYLREEATRLSTASFQALVGSESSLTSYRSNDPLQSLAASSRDAPGLDDAPLTAVRGAGLSTAPSATTGMAWVWLVTWARCRLAFSRKTTKYWGT